MSQTLPNTATLVGSGSHLTRGNGRLRSSQRHGMVTLSRRRLLMAALTVATYAILLGLIAYVLSFGGFGIIDGVMLAALAVGLPWTVLDRKSVV